MPHTVLPFSDALCYEEHAFFCENMFLSSPCEWQLASPGSFLLSLELGSKLIVRLPRFARATIGSEMMKGCDSHSSCVESPAVGFLQWFASAFLLLASAGIVLSTGSAANTKLVSKAECCRITVIHSGHQAATRGSPHPFQCARSGLLSSLCEE